MTPTATPAHPSPDALHDARRGSALGYGIGAGLAVMAVVILGHVLYMVVYGHLIHPGEPAPYYTAHAQASGPWFSLVAGGPVWYLAAHVVARRTRASAAKIAVTMWVTYMVLELGTFLAMSAAVRPLFVLSWGTKLAAAWLGAVAARRGGRPAIR